MASARFRLAFLWLVPVISVADLVWAIGAKIGLGLTLGLGLYKEEVIHIMVQTTLIIALVLFFVVYSPAVEDRFDVEVENGPPPPQGDEQGK